MRLSEMTRLVEAVEHRFFLLRDLLAVGKPAEGWDRLIPAADRVADDPERAVINQGLSRHVDLAFACQEYGSAAVVKGVGVVIVE
jgi:hypothetical protein